MHSFRRAFLTCVFALIVAGRASAGTISVPAGGDLQAALDRAQPGDTVMLQPGATYAGNFVLGVKGGSTYVTVRTALPDTQLPAPGTRMTPTLAGNLARIVAPNGDAAIRTAPGAHHWRLLALEFAGANGGGDIVRLGDGSGQQNSMGAVPHDLVIDRCYIHGLPDGSQKRGVALNSASTSILNSWISDIKAPDQDSQALAGWNGPGPFTIRNNYLEAAGENFLLGGADPSINGLVPTGITFSDNWVRKRPEWRGSSWQVKNLFELKNARGVVAENNLFENNWEAAQPGFAILFTPRNQDGNAPWSAVQDVTFRSNVVRHVAAAINVLGHDSPYPSPPTRGVTISGNLIYDVNSQNWGGNGAFLMIGDGPANVTAEHNTVLQSGSIVVAYGAPAPGFVLRNNMALHNDYGIKGDSHGVGNDTIAAYFPGAVITGNVFGGGAASQYPSGNQFPSVSQFYAQFVSASSDNYQLVPSSSYAKAATDGNAVGADAAAIGSVMTVALNGIAEQGRPRPAGSQAAGAAKPRIGGTP